MHTDIWIPGTLQSLDDLFEELRAQQFENQDDHLWYNYSASSFLDCAALCITFDQRNNPKFCSSILIRDCWPPKTYRILNRMWKAGPRTYSLYDGPGPEFVDHIVEQTRWIREYKKAELVFMSRKNKNWQSLVLKSLEPTGLPFKIDEYKYLTCNNFDDEDCWQHIMYLGDESKLDQWSRK